MKEYRLLLHWHPQGSYLARSIFHAFKYAKKAEVIHVGIVVGSNFMAQLNEDSVKYIQELVKQNYTSSCVSFELMVINYELWNFTLFKSKEENLSVDEYKGRYKDLLYNSARDSLGRGLEVCFDNKEYMTSSTYGRGLEIERMKYATTLINTYRELIKKFNPDLAAISHGTYDHYVSVYVAASEESVPVLVVNGGCNMAYICQNQSEVITDPCIANAFAEIVKLYNRDDCLVEKILPADIIDLINKASNQYLPNSSSGILSKSKIFDKGKQKSKPLAMLPVFAELNHHNCLEEVEFKSRYRWLEWCFKKSQESNKELILYAHPQTNAYGQASLTYDLVQAAYEKFPSKYRLLTRLEDLAYMSKEEALVPITMASSVSLEMNMLGKISCVSNYSTSSPLECNVQFKDNDSLLELENRFMDRKDIILDRKIRSTANQALKFNSYNKFGSQDFYIRKAFEKLVWFGNYSKDSTNRFRILLEMYIKEMKAIELPSENFLQLIPY